MKRKFFSKAMALLMTICMVISMSPLTALAADETTEPTQSNSLDFTAMDTTDKLATDGWKWTKETSTLELNSANLNIAGQTWGSSSLESGITLPITSTIVLTGNNTIHYAPANRTGAKEVCGIHAPGNLTIIGDGSLRVEVDSLTGEELPKDAYIYAIHNSYKDTSGTFTVGDETTSPTIVAVAGDAPYSSVGLRSENAMVLKSGRITAQAGKVTVDQTGSSYGISATLGEISNGFHITASCNGSGLSESKSAACTFAYKISVSDTPDWAKNILDTSKSSLTNGTAEEQKYYGTLLGLNIKQTGEDPITLIYSDGSAPEDKGYIYENGNLTIKNDTGMAAWKAYFYSTSPIPTVKSLTIENGVTYIADAFKLGEFSSINIPESVKSIESQAFTACVLTEITIPASVTEIGFQAFNGCSHLDKVIVRSTAPATLGYGVFTDTKFATDHTQGIIVPDETLTAYQTKWSEWKDYMRAASDPEAVTITGLTAPEKTYDGQSVTNDAFGDLVVKKGDLTVTNVPLTYTYYQDGTELKAAPTNAGNYSVVVSAAEGSGFVGNSEEIPFTIEKAPVEVTMNFPVVKIGSTLDYVKAQLEPIYYSGFVNGENETVITKPAEYVLSSGAEFNKAGTYTYTVTPAEAANYTFTYSNNSQLEDNTCDFIVSEEYAVSFVTNGGTAISPVAKLLYDTVTPDEAKTTREGYTLVGWYTDAALTHAWALDDGSNMGTPVTGNVTLYAKWEKTNSLVDYSVTVKDADGKPVFVAKAQETLDKYVTVRLKRGNVTLYSQNVNSADGVTFTGVAPGTYTLEVADFSNGRRYSTQTVTIAQGGSFEAIMYAGVSARLNVEENTPAVMVNGLNEEARANKTENVNSVDLALKVMSKASGELSTEEREAIGKLISGKQCIYLDAQVSLHINDTTETVGNTKTVLELIVPFDMTGKYNASVCRYHGSAAELLQQVSKDGTYSDGQFYIDGNEIHIFTDKFSTYAIAYSESKGGSSSSSSGSSYGIDVPSKIKGGSVTVSPKTASKGTTVTITVTPDKGYTLENLTVLDKDGKELKLTEKNGKYTFTMPAGKVSVKASFMEDNTMLNFFTDVPASAYYYDAVLWAAEKGITSGTSATEFSPNAACTRAQIVTFLWRAAGSPEPKALSSFTDVPTNSYYAKAVAWAVENGITVGTSATTFSPNETCTRAQSVTFLYRAAGSPAVSGNAAFSDVAANAYYAAAVKWAEENGVTSGIGGGLFGSNNDCTRAQIVVFLYRTYHK